MMGLNMYHIIPERLIPKIGAHEYYPDYAFRAFEVLTPNFQMYVEQRIDCYDKQDEAWKEETEPLRIIIWSSAYVCPECGNLWGKHYGTSSWVAQSSWCPLHGGGHFINFQEPVDVDEFPIELLRYEVQVYAPDKDKRLRWRNKDYTEPMVERRASSCQPTQNLTPDPLPKIPVSPEPQPSSSDPPEQGKLQL